MEDKILSRGPRRVEPYVEHIEIAHEAGHLRSPLAASRKSVGDSKNHLELKAENLMGPYWCRLEDGHSAFHRPPPIEYEASDLLDNANQPFQFQGRGREPVLLNERDFHVPLQNEEHAEAGNVSRYSSPSGTVEMLRSSAILE